MILKSYLQLRHWYKKSWEAESEHRGKELIHPEPDGVRLIRVTRQNDRTVIEICIKPVGYPHLFSGD